MTYKEWSIELMKRGLTPNQARKDIGVTPQSLYKWRQNNKVGRLGIQYLNNVKTTTEGSCEAVLAERGKEYGSFEDNILTIAKYKPGLKVSFQAKVGKELLVETAVDYVSYMLALKTARSQSKTVSARAYADCLTDFVNYYRLLVDLLHENCDFYNVEFVEPYTIKSTMDIARDVLMKTGL